MLSLALAVASIVSMGIWGGLAWGVVVDITKHQAALKRAQEPKEVIVPDTLNEWVKEYEASQAQPGD